MLNFLRSTEIGTAQLVVVGVKRGERECQRECFLRAGPPQPCPVCLLRRMFSKQPSSFLYEMSEKM